MEKIKELGWKPVAAAGAVLGLLAGILGVAGVGAGALIVGILAAIVTFGGLFIVCGDSAGGNGGKGDKYKKLFMNLPIGFAQAKMIGSFAIVRTISGVSVPGAETPIKISAPLITSASVPFSWL